MVLAGTLSSLLVLEIAVFGVIRQFCVAAFRRLRTNAPNIQLLALEILDLRCDSELLLSISTNLHSLFLEGYTENTVSSFISFDAPKPTYLRLIALPLLNLETIQDSPWRFKRLETVLLHRCQSNRSFSHHASSTHDDAPAFPSLHSIIFGDSEAFASIRSVAERWETVDPGYLTLKWLGFVGGGHPLGAGDKS